MARRGIDVSPIQWAEDAERTLLNAEDVQLAVVDVMLGQRGGTDRYALHNTFYGLTTGLTLARFLAEHRKEIFPQRLALWTHARNPSVLKQAEALAVEFEIPLLRKGSFRTAKQFADRVEDILRGIRVDGEEEYEASEGNG